VSNICGSDLHHLKPGKRVLLKSFNGTLTAPSDIKPEENYWQLIGNKAIVEASNKSDRVLVMFEHDLSALGLVSHNDLSSLWILISDLKFVCRY
jgi:hypothetical protein